jgi:hypothetical protein
VLVVVGQQRASRRSRNERSTLAGTVASKSSCEVTSSLVTTETAEVPPSRPPQRGQPPRAAGLVQRAGQRGHVPGRPLTPTVT